MNKNQLVKAVASKTGFSKTQTEHIFDSIVETIKDEIRNDGNVKIVGFASITSAIRKERTGRNPATGKSLIIPTKKIVKIKPSQFL